MCHKDPQIWWFRRPGSASYGRAVKIGIGLPNQVRDVPPTLLPRWAALAEEAGFSTLGSVGRLGYPGVMDTVALAVAAGVTSRIALLSTILIGPAWPAALLAKEVAGIDGVSGGRLTLGVGLGGRPDDFLADGHPARGLGGRMDRDLETYHDVWRGKPVGGGPNPAVPSGTREVPLLFAGFADAAMARMAKWGGGYIGASMPPALVAQHFTRAREAWSAAGRAGSPRLVAICYYALGDPEAGRASIYDYGLGRGEEFARRVASGVRDSAEAVRRAVIEFEATGAEELIFNPANADAADLDRLAGIVL
jgi:alkanesulfonate monooxygenase SsuD/methylene tetrahydromethanopterin reductase-like flavin-dependent oxidoreductase (luciferase family)